MTLLPEELKWKLIEDKPLGEGGQGYVYKVIDKENPSEPPRAIKLLKNDVSEQVLSRFHREIEATQRIDHPNIIRILDHSAPNATFNYYVMEFFEGAQALKTILRKSSFRNNVAQGLRLFRTLVNVIRACDDAHVVHRDLSPGNVLILEDKSIKVIDFGICQIEGHSRITLTDEKLGTVLYVTRMRNRLRRIYHFKV